MKSAAELTSYFGSDLLIPGEIRRRRNQTIIDRHEAQFSTTHAFRERGDLVYRFDGGGVAPPAPYPATPQMRAILSRELMEARSLGIRRE